MALNLQTLKIFTKQYIPTERVYNVDDSVKFYHPTRREMVMGTIQFIDWDGSKCLAIPDGVARAYVVGADFADYVKADDLEPAGTFGRVVEVATA